MNLEQHPVAQRPPHALMGTLQPAPPSSIHTHSHCVATSQPQACTHGDMVHPQWAAAREEAYTGLVYEQLGGDWDREFP